MRITVARSSIGGMMLAARASLKLYRKPYSIEDISRRNDAGGSGEFETLMIDLGAEFAKVAE